MYGRGINEISKNECQATVTLMTESHGPGLVANGIRGFKFADMPPVSPFLLPFSFPSLFPLFFARGGSWMREEWWLSLIHI